MDGARFAHWHGPRPLQGYLQRPSLYERPYESLESQAVIEILLAFGKQPVVGLGADPSDVVGDFVCAGPHFDAVFAARMAVRPGDVGEAGMAEMGIRRGIGVAAVPVDALVVEIGRASRRERV